MGLLSRSNLEYIENIPYKTIDVGRKKIFVSLKVHVFLVVQDVFFLRNWVKLCFSLMKLFDWNETFVLSYYNSCYSIDCEMTADDGQKR